MTNIQREVWRVIDNDASVKKNLLEKLINISALARKIAKEHSLDSNIDAVISAIRRYEGNVEKKQHLRKIYSLLKEAKLSTRTKLASVLFKKNMGIRKKLAELYSKIDFEGGDTLRIFEVTKYIKIIIDDKTVKLVKDIFETKEIVNVATKLGELSIDYNLDITKTPGIFATLSNELASNGISIVDSMICYSEHIIIVDEEDLEKTFNVIFMLIRK
ncbi:MAG: hypothetical protein ISS25_04610 [Nanoarchaeota archaeon]|nr:hypothetical protein [DPANN group archaeon]MBL7117082.1 hypothetical protein [Nanoarchaeota archaeon]